MVAETDRQVRYPQPLGMEIPMTTVSIGTHRHGGISPLAPGYYLVRPARVWFEALAPTEPHFDTRHAIGHCPGRSETEQLFRGVASHLPGARRPTLEGHDPLGAPG
jgi:hypothetical protein